jgi:hypothetical protein
MPQGLTRLIIFAAVALFIGAAFMGWVMGE